MLQSLYTRLRPADVDAVAAPEAPAFARLRAATVREAASLLAGIRTRSLYRDIGFVRFGDYVLEHLGVSARTAQEWLRTEEALSRLPLLSSAFDSGVVTSSHVRLLARVATPHTEAFWVRLAQGTPVRFLARRVKAIEAGERAGAREESVEGDMGPTEQGEGLTEGALRQLSGLHRPGGGSDTSAFGSPFDDPDAVPHERLTIRTVGWAASLWRDTVTLVRRLCGREENTTGCFEYVLAEFMSGGRVGHGSEPVEASPNMQPPASGPATGSSDSRQHGVRSELADQLQSGSASRGNGQLSDEPDCPTIDLTSSQADRQAQEAGLVSGASFDPSGARNGDGLPVEQDTADSSGLPTLNARAVDRRLRRLVSERQRHELFLADHLRSVADARTWWHQGFGSLADYAASRLGLCERNVYYLLKLRRTLDGLPDLRRVFVTGRVTLRQTLLIGGVASTSTVRAWIRRATDVTLRRLEDEVGYMEHLRDVRPALYLRLKGVPIPEGIILVPGAQPRLHASAPLDGEAAGFLAMLHAEEAAVPAPGGVCVINMMVEPDVAAMWRSAVERCRAVLGTAATESDALAAILCHVWQSWETREIAAQRRAHPVLERDGWRCAAPGCRSVGTGRLQEHHIIFRSAGGTDDKWNEVGICVGHHLGLVHENKVRVTGRAPDGLTWEMGIEPGLEPFAVFQGDRRVASAGFQVVL